MSVRGRTCRNGAGAGLVSGGLGGDLDGDGEPGGIDDHYTGYITWTRRTTRPLKVNYPLPQGIAGGPWSGPERGRPATVMKSNHHRARSQTSTILTVTCSVREVEQCI